MLFHQSRLGTTDSEHTTQRYGAVSELRRVSALASVVPTAQRMSRIAVILANAIAQGTMLAINGRVLGSQSRTPHARGDVDHAVQADVAGDARKLGVMQRSRAIVRGTGWEVVDGLGLSDEESYPLAEEEHD